MKFEEYIQYDGMGLAELIQKGEISVMELNDLAGKFIVEKNAKLNFLVCDMREHAKQRISQGLPKGPYSGVPFLVKDITMDYPGFPSTHGSRALKNQIPDKKSVMVERYENAGLVILGKTNTPEFGALATTKNALFGATLNPWDTSRTSGGSSGGSAAAVAARVVPFAHGNDGAGSLRIPASCCGIFTLKPSRGLMPSYLPGRTMQGMLTDHVLSISVRDSAAVLDATAGAKFGDLFTSVRPTSGFLQSLNEAPKKLKIAVSVAPFSPTTVNADCIQAVEKTMKICESLNHQVEYAKFPIDQNRYVELVAILFITELANGITTAKSILKDKDFDKKLEPVTYLIAQLAKAFSGVNFAKAMNDADVLRVDIESFFQNYDVLLTPTLGQPPLKIGGFSPNTLETWVLKIINLIPSHNLKQKTLFRAIEKGLSFAPFTALWNFTGHPAISVPLHWNANNLPIGVQFIAGLNQDAQLLQLAAQLEQAQPWKNKIPVV